MKKIILRIAIILIFLGACFSFYYSFNKMKTISEINNASNTMDISSAAFKNNETLPQKYTCDGENISPPLEFKGAPENTKSLALVVEDPDALFGPWIHWVLWNIDPAVKEIGENSVPEGASQGMTSFKEAKYGGPCPPSGTHHYVFKIFALDTKLDLAASSEDKDMARAMQGHIMAEGKLTGLYR